jgi:hypothetical protein
MIGKTSDGLLHRIAAHSNSLRERSTKWAMMVTEGDIEARCNSQEIKSDVSGVIDLEFRGIDMDSIGRQYEHVLTTSKDRSLGNEV